jgi:hypothetical protein
MPVLSSLPSTATARVAPARRASRAVSAPVRRSPPALAAAQPAAAVSCRLPSRRGAVVLRAAADGGAPATVASSTNGAAASQAVTGVAVFSAAPYVRDFFEGARACGELVVRAALR